VHDQQRQVRAQIGPQQGVVVATRAFDAGTVIDLDALENGFVVRDAPQSLAPDDAVTDIDELSGATLAGPLPAGAILTRVQLTPESGATFRLRRGERGLVVPVAPVGGGVPTTGARVDVFAAGEAGGGFAELVVAGSEVLAVGEVADPAGDSGIPDDAAPETGGLTVSISLTLRVSLRQAARIMAAQAGGSRLAVIDRPRGERDAGPVVERMSASAN
jgi:Flp pilus assembly protein CpaB